ncbi:AcrR family transcriptional regulator [Rhodococcus fascians]|uniref:TetR/AcrR family transcriptional regulator n=1 Tax=Nocardiaceae TaxID=85025 RepID=UPI002866B468|nr:MULTISPECIES: TetR/AcrR family transcriptional regulator [Rhodococcus]MDR6908528.1 AcrR family transcriptional regulator [Rhodococcus sp. 3258]MDR6930655.1 AcrR family transcriptional regulator [Rhodococcus fascians]
MPPPPVARDKSLNAFVKLVLEQGEKAATLDAVAAAAGISKGGLMYHFPSKEALVEGLMRVVEELAAEDVRRMREHPEGPADYHIRTSTFHDTAVDRAVVATMRLSQGANELAQQTLERIRQSWLDALNEQIADPAVAEAVLLMGDGLYFAAASAGTDHRSPDHIEALVGVVHRLIDSRP